MYEKRASSIFTLSLASRSFLPYLLVLAPPSSLSQILGKQRKTSVAVGMGSHDNELDNDETCLASHSVYSSKNSSEGNTELR